MKPIIAPVLETGFDWITTTAATARAQNRLHRLGHSLLREERKAGNDLRPWSFAGYEGLKCGSVQIGKRHDSTCMRISSGVASEFWQQAYHAGESFSRVDLQTTLQLDHDPQKLISRVYRAALKKTKISGRARTCTILKSSNGTATVYLGQRQSAIFLRCYDKGRESGLLHYADCARFEAEIKGPICLSILRSCSASSYPLVKIAEVISECFAKSGVVLGQPTAPLDTMCVPRRRPDNVRRLEWLKTQVRPSVQLLVSSGMLGEVISALDLQTALSASTTGARVIQLKRVGG